MRVLHSAAVTNHANFLNLRYPYARIQLMKGLKSDLLASFETYLTATPAVSLPPFAEVIETHKAMVYSIGWHFLRDRPAAEELAQEVFLQLHRNWSAMKSPEHIVFWLRK